MAEYIEKKAALVAIRNLYPGIPCTKRLMQKWHEENRNFMQCEIAIEKLPAADVQPVRHGRWINHGWTTVCSECGEDYAFAKRSYCPNCGAFMAAETEEEAEK